jgi:hypothetical protein
MIWLPPSRRFLLVILADLDQAFQLAPRRGDRLDDEANWLQIAAELAAVRERLYRERRQATM